MNKIIQISIYLFLGITIQLVSFSSCSTLHLPANINMPMATEENHTKFTAGANLNSALFQFSSTIDTSWAVIGGGSVAYGSYLNAGPIYFSQGYNHFDAEFGVGRYKKIKQKMFFEYYGGICYFYASNYGSDYLNSNEGIFIQGDFISKKNNFVEFAAGAKLAGYYSNYGYAILNPQAGATFRFGPEHLKLWASASIDYTISPLNKNEMLKIYISAGLTVDIFIKKNN